MDLEQQPAAAGGGADRWVPQGAIGAWWWQGVRSAFLMKPQWEGLQTTPAVVAILFLVPSLLGVLVERLYIDGPANFFWHSLATGWLGSVLVVWACWAVLAARDEAEASGRPRDAGSLFGMLCALALPLLVVSSLLFVPMSRAGMFDAGEGTSLWVVRAVGIVFAAWHFLAHVLLLWRAASPQLLPRLTSVLVVAATMAINQWLLPVRHWYPAPALQAAEDEAQDEWRLTQEVMEAQPGVLSRGLASLDKQRPGMIDMYVLTFAPYAEEEVFKRESEMVADVMGQQFDAAGRTVQLINHRDTATSRPWATPLNLRRTILRVAELMDRDEDVLFLHFASHGARNGALSASFWPMDVDPVTPQLLKQWLDEAGIRHRVVSVSACYSGSWIGPLADPDALVMTAADAEHTSYGCGRLSPLTYFGRAMYDEGMRATLSFEDAHAKARTVIEQREIEAGKKDGFSNPQISIGDGMREVLRNLEAQRAKGS